jgi:hypothetical protein
MSHDNGKVGGNHVGGDHENGAQCAASMRACPTRCNGREPLISHLITLGLCQLRQGEYYHKCHGCVFAGVQTHGPHPVVLLPRPEASPATPEVPARTPNGLLATR